MSVNTSYHQEHRLFLDVPRRGLTIVGDAYTVEIRASRPTKNEALHDIRVFINELESAYQELLAG